MPPTGPLNACRTIHCPALAVRTRRRDWLCPSSNQFRGDARLDESCLEAGASRPRASRRKTDAQVDQGPDGDGQPRYRRRSRSERPLGEQGRPTPLPPALEGPSPRVNADRSTSPAASLPSDSDESALDAIAATGRPLTLPEAIKLAFRYQPRLHAQLESIEQARGQQQIAFSTFLPTIAGNYDVGDVQPRSGRQTRSHSGRVCRDSISYPAWVPCPSA